MNIDTGKLRMLAEGEVPDGNEIPVDIDDATAKQLNEMQVSLHDHRSKLGKKLTYERMTKNQRKRVRQRMRGKR